MQPDYMVPYWEGLRNQHLLIQRCQDCSVFQFYPRPFCLHCLSRRIQWVEACGEGSIYSFTVVHRAPSAKFVPLVPYVLAVVQLAEGPTLMTNIVDSNPAHLRIGHAVQLTFRERDGNFIPQFTPIKEAVSS